MAAEPGWRPEVHARIAPLADAWDALADRQAAPPFLRPGWFAAWWDAFGHGRLEVLALARDGRLVAVLPLGRRAGVLRSLSNWHTPAFAALAEPGAEPALARLLLARGARQVVLEFVDPGSAFVRACHDAAAADGGRALVHQLQRSPYLGVGGEWEAFERRQFSGRHRALLRRRCRQLMAAGALALEVGDGGDALDRLLAEGVAVEAASWKGEQGTAIGSRPETVRFYSAVARWAAGRGELRLALLRVDDRAVAFDFALEADGVHYLLKTGYDPAYRHLGPGAVLRHDMIARAFARGLDTYEFLGQDDPWKRDWTSHGHGRARVQLFSPGAAGRLDHAAWAYAAPLARRAVARVRR